LPQYSDYLLTIFDRGRKTGQSVGIENLPFAYSRNGFDEESYADVTFTPVLDASGNVGGFYQGAHYTTQMIQYERR
jgi:hypothetical protein